MVLGPGRNERDLLRALADEIEAAQLMPHSIAIDWYEDGCYLRVASESLVTARPQVGMAEQFTLRDDREL